MRQRDRIFQGRFFQGQGLHIAGLSILIAGLLLARSLPGFSEGSLWGVNTESWVWLGVGNAVLHQVYVWLCWRLELYGHRLSRTLGSSAFILYAAGFTLLILVRPVLATLLAISNAGSLGLDPWPLRTLAILFVLPVVYLGWSVARYFGLQRAYGIDHFDAPKRSLPMVKRGIFRFASNAMYTFGFLALWIPPLWTGSVAGLVMALFSHLYIWVHWFATEKPDMRAIYGS